MSQPIFIAAFAGTALAWFILFLIALAVFLWFVSWIFFPADELVPVSQTLKDLTGLDERMAARLAPFGIRSDRGLMRLTPRGQQELESQLGLHNGEYDRWRREILARWRNQYLPPAFREIKEISPDPEFGGIYTKRPREADDLTKLTGVDKVTANRLNNAGIYTFEQFRLMMPEQRACVKQKFHLTDLDFDKLPDYGVTAQWLSFMAEGKDGNPKNVAASKAQPTSPESGIVASSFNSSHAINSASADMQSLEDRQPTGPSNAAHTATATQPNATSQPTIPTTQMDAQLGRLYSAPPPHRDDLTKLNGIDKEAAARLNAAGIYTVAQIQSLSLSQRTTFQQRFQLPDFDFTQWSGNETTPVKASTEKSQHPNLGFVYIAKPQQTDDLTQLDGITQALASKMNQDGIYTFDQLDSMNESQLANFRSRFGLPDFKPIPSQRDSIRRHDPAEAHSSKPHFSTGYSSSAGESTAARTVVGFAATGDATARPSTDTTGQIDNVPHPELPSASSDKVTKDTQQRSGSPLGPVYSSRPENADDLERLPNIDAATAARLNEAGIYTFEQLTSLTLPQQAQLRNRFGLEQANFAEWQRLHFAWSRGVSTSLDVGPTREREGWLHSVRLPMVAPGVFDGKKLVAYPEQVIFRGTAPEHWGTDVSSSQAGVERAVAATDIRTDINYVRIRRMDTRDSVVTEISKSQLFEPGPETDSGWNGLCERFFGARHLGVYASQIPKEVETKFGLGGWGFGHQFDGNEDQDHCWAGRLIPPTSFEISVGRVGVAAGTVVFRSKDPTIWDCLVRDSTDHWSIPIANVSHPVSFVRIMRTDTGQAAIVKTDPVNATRRSANPDFGWNGLNDHFYGGHHLGIYLQSAPQDVEIAYGEGGWGFGHPYHQNDRQAYGWAGQAIPETVFEISLLENVPDHLRSEIIG